MDRAAANLAKLTAIWERAQPLLPNGPSRGSSREYDDLRRSWSSLLSGLPRIDGWTVTVWLPDADEVGATFVDYWDLGEPAFPLMNEIEQPGKDLDEYRFRLGRARRRAVRDRLLELASMIDLTLPKVVAGVPRESIEPVEHPGVSEVAAAVGEIERLLSDTTERRGRWGDLHRHLYFGQGHDWHDIIEIDWPSVREDIESAGLSSDDPIPVADVDLGVAAAAHPSGPASTALAWGALSDDDFERLLFDVLRGIDGYQNVQWLMKTRAPDRGRDLSLERVIRDGSGTVRTERVIVQAKHWTSKSVGPADIAATLATMNLWEPPTVQWLLMATSGRFTSDAVATVERRNTSGGPPHVELWPDSRLETLLAQRPDLVAAYGLRG